MPSLVFLAIVVGSIAFISFRGGPSVMGIVVSMLVAGVFLVSPLIPGVWGGQGEAFMATIPLAPFIFLICLAVTSVVMPKGRAY